MFSITPTGAENVIHAFKPGADGVGPTADLIAVGGELYGTTEGGGPNGFGAVFRISTSGVEKVLYSFNATDGSGPNGLLNLGGKLYGTTLIGGASDAGTIFGITRAGKRTLSYSFAGGADGVGPVSALTNLHGTLYGTTSGDVFGNPSPGTVFSVTKSGTETVIYTFTGGSDGSNPLAGLINVGGTLYGTTYDGGPSNAGTVFAIVP